MAIDIVASMRVFTAVVDAGSFADAADKLELSRGMATRYVAQLEAHLGLRLLNRTTRKLSLTEAGNDYYRRATHILAMVEEAERSAAQDASVPRGTLRIATTPIFGYRHLDRLIADYLRSNRGVQVDLALNDRVVDLVEEGFDLAIRLAPQVAPGLIARRLTRAPIVACAAPRYLKRHGTPQSPEDLAGHNCLTQPYSTAHGTWRLWRKGVERTVRVSGNFRSNNGHVLVTAAIEGLGVVLEPAFVVFEALEKKRLVRVLPEWEGDEFWLFAVYPNRQFLPSKVRSFIDFLAERFAPEPYWGISTTNSER
jgi:DNA-binding transcriptional LysR family regulator